ncbi:Neurofibromin, partial [Trichinella zimbabwensis]
LFNGIYAYFCRKVKLFLNVMKAFSFQKPLEWVSSLLARFEDQLPVKTGPLKNQSRLLLEQSRACLVNVSKLKFSMVVGGLIRVLQTVNSMKTSAEQDLFDSQCFILDTLERCLAGPQDVSSRIDEANNVKIIIHEMCQFIQLSSDSNQAIQLKEKASKVIYNLSLSSFNVIFNRIVAKLKAVSCEPSAVSVPSDLMTSSSDNVDIELMQYIHFDLKSLIKLLREISYHKPFKKENNQILFRSLENVIWNWMDTYPDQFHNLQVEQNNELNDCCDRLFDQLDTYGAESSKKKAIVWPLQMMLLILCPKVLEEIHHISCGAPCPIRLLKKKVFFDSIKKTMSQGHSHTCKHHLLSSACIAGVKLCKAAIYVNVVDSANVFFALLQLIITDLKSYLFNPIKPLFKNPSSAQELDVMIDCFVALFRLSYNNEVFRICLNAHTVVPHQLVLVMALYRIAVQARLPWWPKIDLVYSRSGELLQMFNETLSRVCQGASVVGCMLSTAPTQQSSHGQASTTHMPLRVTHSLHRMTGKLKEKSLTGSQASSTGGAGGGAGGGGCVGGCTVASAASVSSLTGNASNSSVEDGCQQLLFWLIRLMCIEPTLFLHHSPESSTLAPSSSTAELISGLVNLVGNSNQMPELAQEAMEAILCLHHPENIRMWHPDSTFTTVQSLWYISSQLLFYICQKLLQFQLANFSETLRWLRQLLVYRNLYLLSNREIANYGSSEQLCKQAAQKLETVCFVYLWSLDNDTAITALSVFRILCEEAEIRCSGDELPVEYADHAELASATNLQTVGRVVLQKSINSYLKKLLIPSAGCCEAWEATYRYWEALTKFLKAYPKSKQEDSYQVVENLIKQLVSQKLGRSSEQEFEMTVKLWANMTGFLCSVGGVVIKSCKNTTLYYDSSGNLPPSAETSDKSTTAAASDLSTSTPDLFCSVNSFLSQLLTLLLVQSDKLEVAVVRHIKELCSYELHQLLIGHFFEQIRTITDRFIDNDDVIIICLRNTEFIEHVVYIMKNILLGCCKQNVRNVEISCIEPIMLNLCRYVHHLEVNCQSVTIKGKICQLIEVIMRNYENIIFRSEIRFRNRLVDMIADWVICNNSPSASSCIAAVVGVGAFPSEASLPLRDFNTLCMVALGALMRDLPLQPNCPNLTTGQNNLQNTAVLNKSQLFQKHFSLFMNVLNDCAMNENTGAGDFDIDTVSRGDDTSSHPSVEDTSASSVPHVTRGAGRVGVGAGATSVGRRFRETKTEQLRRATILAMSNLLAANIDIGLVHAVGMAYHRDRRARVAFVEVLTKILQEGTEFETLNETVMADRFDELVKLTTMITVDGELPIVNALASVVQTEHMDELARVLTTLFSSKNLLHELLWKLFIKEVELAEAPTTLFRGNTVASKVMGYCFKLYGAKYLHSLLHDFVNATVEHSTSNYEIDPSRLEADDNLAENTTNLMELVESILSLIVHSADRFPVQLKGMLNVLFYVVNARFPNTGLLAVGMIVFLRFFNPAIVSPFEYGLTENYPNANVKRGLMLVSKILQQIANQTISLKESCLQPFNAFIQSKFEPTRRFFMNIAVEFRFDADASSQYYMSYMNDTPTCALHRLLWQYQDKIGEFFTTMRSHDRVARRLATLLAQLGPANGRAGSKQWTNVDLDSTRFEELMSRQSAADKDEYNSIKENNIFYQCGISRASNPVFYFIANRFKVGEVNGNMLIYHVLMSLKSKRNEHFELVVDLTHASTENRFRTELLHKWFLVLSEAMQQNIIAAYICNCNSWTRDYIRFHERLFRPLKANHKLYFLDHVHQLNDYISPEWQRLPVSTLQIDEDVLTFNNALKICHKNMKCSIKVGPTSLQITTLDRQKVLGHNVILNDVYYASEIQEVCLVDDSSMTLTILNECSPLTLMHADCEQIASAIVNLRTRYELSQPDQAVLHAKIRAKDVPGTLLNMALLNLGSTYASLRTAAYNLLCALAATFNFRIEGQLLETEGLLIPANNTIFIKNISEKLAMNETHLTLEFLHECIQGFRQSPIDLKHLCLEYITPWLGNLPRFCRVSGNDNSKRRAVSKVLDKLITLTIEEIEMYPSIQAKIWGSIGRLSELLDIILDRFLKRSITGGFGSMPAEVMADTSVALAAANTKLVSDILIGRLMQVLEKSCLNPQATLEEHILWDDIAILARYLLFQSFNNCLDVISHLPVLFHFVTVLVNTGPLALRASIHGLVVNVIHSLCTCPSSFSETTKANLRLALTEFFLPKFYRLFGVSNLTVKSVAATAFRISPRMSLPIHCSGDYMASGSIAPRQDRLTLPNLETIADSLVDLLETCNQDIKNRDLCNEWEKISYYFTMRFNPALQSRALVVYSCLSKKTDESVIKQLLNLLLQFVKRRDDCNLLSAVLMALRRLTPLLPSIHCTLLARLFWISVIILQLEDASLYEHGLALLEQILRSLDSLNVFEYEPFEKVMMEARPLLEWEFKAMDQQMGISFKHNFHFAVVAYLLKGYRHPSQSVVSRTVRLFSLILGIVAKYTKRDRYEVTVENVAYLVALLPVSEEVRLRCPLRHSTLRALSLCGPSENASNNDPTVGSFPSPAQADKLQPCSRRSALCIQRLQHSCDSLQTLAAARSAATVGSGKLMRTVTGAGDTFSGQMWSPSSMTVVGFTGQRSRSLPLSGLSTCSLSLPNENGQEQQEQQQQQQQQQQEQQEQQQQEYPDKSEQNCKDSNEDDRPSAATTTTAAEKSTTKSEPTNESEESKAQQQRLSSNGKNGGQSSRTAFYENLLLDEDVLCEPSLQVLVLTVLGTLVRNYADENETRTLFEYLAEASLVFPKVFPVIHCLLDQRITQVLQMSHDAAVLRAVLHIIQNMIPSQETTDTYQQQHLTLLQSKKTKEEEFFFSHFDVTNYIYIFHIILLCFAYFSRLRVWRLLALCRTIFFEGEHSLLLINYPQRGSTAQLQIAPESLTCLERLIGSLGEVHLQTPPPLSPFGTSEVGYFRQESFSGTSRANSVTLERSATSDG